MQSFEGNKHLVVTSIRHCVIVKRLTVLVTKSLISRQDVILKASPWCENVPQSYTCLTCGLTLQYCICHMYIYSM